MATVSDVKTYSGSGYRAKVLSAQHYYAFGMQMPNKSFNLPSYSSLNRYRFGFNGMERDDEVSGQGNQYDYGMRMYSSRLGRFLSVDRLSAKRPYLSTYLYASNSPIRAIDNGDIDIIVNIWYKGQDGNYIKSESYYDYIETGEDLRNLERTPYEINLYGYLIDVNPASNVVESRFVVEKVVENANSALDGEQLAWRDNPGTTLVFKIQQKLGSFIGTAQFNNTAYDQDPLTGEYKNRITRISEAADGLLQLTILGKVGVGGGLKKFIIGELIDIGFEDGISKIIEKTGLTDQQTANLAYHSLKMMIEFRLKPKDITQMIENVQSSVNTSNEATNFAVEYMKQYGVDLNAPVDYKAAGKEAVKKIIKTKKFIDKSQR